MIFEYSVYSVVISPFSILILLIWILSLCPLVSLAKGLSILLLSQRTSSRFYWFFVSTWLISALYLIISWHLLLLGVCWEQNKRRGGVLDWGLGRSRLRNKCPHPARVSLFSGQSGMGGLLSTLSTHPWVGIPLSHSSGGGQGAALPGKPSPSYFAKAPRVVG